jgi:hypothetical protein
MIPDDAPKPQTPADGLARAARASWLAPLIAVSLNCFAGDATSRIPTLGLLVSGLQIVLLAGGIAAGVYALLGARKTRDGGRVIAPAAIGVLLCTGLLGLNILFRAGVITIPAQPTTEPLSSPAPPLPPLSSPTSAPASQSSASEVP